MIDLLRTRVIGLARVAMLVAALLAPAPVHHLPAADSAALDAFVLAGGDLADICTPADGDGMADQTGCLACHVVGTAEVPMPHQMPRTAGLLVLAKVTAPKESRARRQVLDPAHALRAPPLA